MIAPTCLCCQETFTLNKYHVHDQEYCAEPECRCASHAAANAKWRSGQKRDDPCRESQRKARGRRREKFRTSLEISRWRKQLAWQQMLLFGILGLVSGAAAGAELGKTISRCLDCGRELFRADPALWGDLAENSCPGFGFR